MCEGCERVCVRGVRGVCAPCAGCVRFPSSKLTLPVGQTLLEKSCDSRKLTFKIVKVTNIIGTR